MASAHPDDALFAVGGVHVTPAAALLAGLFAIGAAYQLWSRRATAKGPGGAAANAAFEAYRLAANGGVPPSSSSGGGNGNGTADAGADDADDPYPCGPLRVYFGSQTGTAEEFANTLVEEGKKHGFDAQAVDLEDFDEDDFASGPLSEALHIFAVATYGEGEPTDNAIGFYKWLKDSESGALPETLQFAVFGLGNTQYDHFNAMGRNVNRLLGDLGAQRAYDYGEGDDDGTLEEDFENWRDGLWPTLVARFGGAELAARQASAGAAAALDWKPAYKVVWMDSDSGRGRDVQALASKARAKVIKQVLAGIEKHDPDRSVTRASLQYFHAKDTPVVSNVELRADNGTEADQDGEFGATVQVDFNLAAAGMTYGTADTLAVCCENARDIVETLASWQGYDLDAYFLHQMDDPVAKRTCSYKPMFPTPCTVRHALTQYCDLTSPVRKAMLPKLAQFTTVPAQRERLLFLASPEGRNDFAAWVSRPVRTIVEVLETFPSCRVPFAAFLEIVPRLMSRDYTISSSAAVSPGVCSITCKVLRGAKPVAPGEEGAPRRQHRGVCSNFLLREGQSCKVFVRPSTFNMPKDPSVPIIMVGPGTGIAPMRAFLQERRHQRATLGAGAVGETDLFFGCRRRHEDFIYEEELLSYTQDGTLTNLHLGEFVCVCVCVCACVHARLHVIGKVACCVCFTLRLNTRSHQPP